MITTLLCITIVAVVCLFVAIAVLIIKMNEKNHIDLINSEDFEVIKGHAKAIALEKIIERMSDVYEKRMSKDLEKLIDEEGL